MPKAKNLRTLRKAANLTQEQFADRIGVSRKTVHEWETRKRAIPMPSTKRIAEFFGIDYHDFCDRDASQIIEVTDDEIRQLNRFRQLSETSKAIIRAAIDAACLMEKDNS